MNTMIRGLWLALFAFVLCVFAYPNVSYADVSVESRQLVAKRRSGRAAFNYTYKIEVAVNGPAIENVVAYLTCENQGTTVIDGVVEMGNLGTDSLTLSDDTFTIRQDRRFPFDPQCLVWDIAFDSTLLLSGVVTDNPLGSANVIITVDYGEAGRPIIEAFGDAGRPIIETFNTVAEPDGSYEIEVPVGAEDGFVTIDADCPVDGPCSDEQDGAELTSNLGSVGGLHSEGSPGSIVIGGEDVTHITTALAVLAQQAAGGEILTDEALQAAESQVPGEDLVNLAAAIKTVVDNDIPIPGGEEFLAFLEEPGNAEAFVMEQMEENPDEFMAALEETVEELPLVYVEADLNDTVLYTAFVSENPLVITGSGFVFDTGGTGTVTDFFGFSTMDWSVDVDGNLIVEPDELIRTFIQSCDVGGGALEQRETQQIVEQITMIRIVQGVESDQIFQFERIRTVFHPDCDLPDEVFEGTPDPANVFLAINNEQIIPVDPVDLAGNTFAAEYYHVDNNSVGNLDDRFGADFLSFVGDGTGTTTRRGFGFNWSVDTDGRLDVVFDNGDTNQYVVFSDDGGPIVRSLVLTDLSDGTVLATGSFAIDPDGMTEFSVADLTNMHFRNVFSVLEGGLFDFLFEDGGTGCLNFGTALRDITWLSTADNRMELIRNFAFDPSIVQVNRSWQGGATVMGLLGDRLWVIENRESNDFADPDYVFSDPTETPGRINAYESLGDFSNNVLPVANDDDVTTNVDTTIEIDVLANDTDADGNNLLIINFTGSDEGGSVQGVFDTGFLRIEAISYTPPPLFEGDDRFSYFINDVNGCALVEGEVFITVEP